MIQKRRMRLPVQLAFAILLTWTNAHVAWSITNEDTDLAIVDELHTPQAKHVDQFELLTLVQNGQTKEAFNIAFDGGKSLMTTVFNALDGVGANVGDGSRFSRVPRADLDGPGQWKSHIPPRVTGPNAQACNQCHRQPADNGAGDAVGAHHRDQLRNGILGEFIRRDVTHLFGTGPMQRLVEEMSEELHSIRDLIADKACHTGKPITAELNTKGVNYGSIIAIPNGNPCEAVFDTSGVTGVNPNLVILPYGWKGTVPTIRAFGRGAAHNNLGMQPIEITGEDFDGDFDGVVNELTIGDMTAIVINNAAQPRPTTKLELAKLGLFDLQIDEAQSIQRGEQVFSNPMIGCANCHMPVLVLDDPIFSEPSQSALYRDAMFPYGPQDPVDPITVGVDPTYPVTVDLTKDQPDNQIVDDDGDLIFHLGALKTDKKGRAIVEIYGDMKRHEMGPGLAETIDESGVPASIFMTENLWGVGSTAPYLHDGRATTLTEAILEHGGEAEEAKNAFKSLSLQRQEDLIAFLENLILFKSDGPIEIHDRQKMHTGNKNN